YPAHPQSLHSFPTRRSSDLLIREYSDSTWHWHVNQRGRLIRRYSKSTDYGKSGRTFCRSIHELRVVQHTTVLRKRRNRPDKRSLVRYWTVLQDSFRRLHRSRVFRPAIILRKRQLPLRELNPESHFLRRQ